jgi:uncharacterized phage protein (TIGR02220 family)
MATHSQNIFKTKDCKKMSIIKVLRRENPFVQIDKSVFEDNTISWKAKGILGYLLTKPNDWKIYVDDIAKHAPTVEKEGKQISKKGSGVSAVYEALKELRAAGYARLTVTRENGVITGKQWEVSEIPVLNAITPYPDNLNEANVNEDNLNEGNRVDTNKEDTNNEIKDIIMSGKPDDTEILPLEEKKKKEKVHPAATLEKKIEALREKYKEFSKDKAKNHGELLKLTKQGNALKAQLETEKEIDAVILRLNEKAGFQYQLTTTEARKVIGKRLAENSLEEVFQVIDFKVREWKDKEEMRQYLRPATLLNGHFEDYYQASLLKPKKKNENEAVYTPPVKRFAQ